MNGTANLHMPRTDQRRLLYTARLLNESATLYLLYIFYFFNIIYRVYCKDIRNSAQNSGKTVFVRAGTPSVRLFQILAYALKKGPAGISGRTFTFIRCI